MMLVGQQMRGQFRLADGGPYHAEAAQPTFQAVPIHRVITKDAGQGPGRDAERAQEQGSFDVRDARGHVGHEERGPDAGGGLVLQEDAPDRRPLLGRPAVVLQFVSLVEFGREQIRSMTTR
jgi:hypothetical protein